MALLIDKDELNKDLLETCFHFPTSKKALIIFTRNPELGKCKTRLAVTIGDENALAIYKTLLKHTADITQHLNVDKYVYYSEQIWKDDVWDQEIFRKKIQEGTNLGSRMENAFKDLFSVGYEKIIIIGSDMYDLNQTDLENAFQSLEKNDFVIGPAEDGGYYLLGMKEVKSEVFRNKDWGSNTVLANTLLDLQNEKVTTLDVRNDIDVFDDIKDITIFQKYIVNKYE
jgi:hypothetical protein